MFIFDSNRYARDPGGVVGQIDELVAKSGGELLASRLWEERRLAYPINGNRKGTYWLTYFRVEGAKIGDMNRTCEINDSILRHLFMKIDPRLVDTLVSHAQSSGKEEKEEPAESSEQDVPKAGAPAEEAVAAASSEESAEA
jgi:small subunit ribosomal protein S6